MTDGLTVFSTTSMTMTCAMAQRTNRTGLAGAFCAAFASFVATSAVAHGEGLQSGAHWLCTLERPLYERTGTVQVTLLDEEGFGAPSLVISFQDGADVPHILNANWAEGLTFSQATPDGAEFTLIQNPFQVTDYKMTIWHPTTDRTDTLAICRET